MTTLQQSTESIIKAISGTNGEHRQSQPPRVSPGIPPWLAPLLLDLISINISFFLAYYIRYYLELGGEVQGEFFVPYSTYLPVQLLFLALLVAMLRLRGLYSLPRGASWLEEVSGIVSATAIASMLVFATVSMVRYPASSRLTFIFAWALAALWLSAFRLLLRFGRSLIYNKGIGSERVVVVGNNPVSRMIMQGLANKRGDGFDVVGFLDTQPAQDFGRFAFLGTVHQMAQVIAEHRVGQVVIALPAPSHQEIMGIIHHCRRDGVSFKIVPDLYEMSLSHVDLDTVMGIPLIGLKEVSIQGWNRVLKRAMDAAVAGAGLILLSPMMLAIAALIKLDSPGPVLFRQKRIGKDGVPLVIHKFRSMRDGAEEGVEHLMPFNEAEGPLFKIKEDPRITRVGRILRRTSLDELPQLWDVLRGDMSLVGPRPPLPHEAERYEDWHLRRLAVKPGITGLWQVSGRSLLSFDEMVLLDIYYIQNWSLGLDLRILFRTLPAVVSGGGAF